MKVQHKLNFFLILALISLSSCSITRNTGVPTSKDYISDYDNTKNKIAGELYLGSLLIEIGYKEVDKALSEFKDLGLNATYFASKSKVIFHYPECFILSDNKTNNLTILFVGTNSRDDWYEDVKSSNYEDVKNDGYYYIPSGHAGFRKGVLNLINYNFISVINTHIEKYMKVKSKEKINVTIMGHSMGAGLAQMATCFLDGVKYIGGEKTTDPKWPLKVNKIFAYAPPYAISSSAITKDWNYMSEHYGSMTYMVIRDNDMVCTLYNAIGNGHIVPVRHYGNFVRITRDGMVSIEKTNWGTSFDNMNYGNMPHHINGYEMALKNSLIDK